MSKSKLDEIKEKIEAFSAPLKEKASHFIEEIQERLPIGRRGYDSEDDEFEEVTKTDIGDSTEGTRGGKVKAREDLNGDDEIASNSEDDEYEDDDESEDDEYEDEDEDEDEDEKKKKQKKLLTQGILILIILYLVYDTMMSDKNPPEPSQKQQEQQRKGNKNLKEQGEGNNFPKREVEKKKEERQKKSVKEKIISHPEPEPEIEQETEPEIEQETEPEIEREAEQKREPEPKPEPKREKEPELESETQMEKIPPPSVSLKKETPDDSKREDHSNNLNDLKEDLSGRIGEKNSQKRTLEEMSSKGKNKIEERIGEEDLSSMRGRDYISPPNYKRLGRGLVYNCVEKHWACVDKFAYFQCRENIKWSKANNKKRECMTKNVYASSSDCTIVQTYYINTNEPTDFCGKRKDKKGVREKVIFPE